MLAALAALALAALPEAAPRLGEADLAPFFAEGPAAGAKAAFDAGRFAEAARLLAKVPGPQARFLRALALAEAGRPAEALDAAGGLESDLPDLADRVHFLRGQELEAQGRRQEAAAALAGVRDGSLLAGAARLARARLLEGAGQPEAALEALVPLLHASPPDDLSAPDATAAALLHAGRLRAASRPPDAAGARAALVECWAGHPLSAEATECRAALGRLPGPSGAPPAPADALRRAEGLLEANRSAAALALLGPLLEGLPAAAADQPLACRVRTAVGRAYRRERRHAEVIAALRPVVEACTDPALRARALYVLAGSAAVAGQRDEAVGHYRRLAREFPAHALADDALLLAAETLARDGRTDEAADALAAVVRDHPSGDARDEARFRMAWMARRAGETDAAVAQLLAIEESERGLDAYEHARAAYWRARLTAERGEEGRAAARAIWADLVARNPTDYYALLARARLREGAGQDADGLPPPLAAPPSPPGSFAAGSLPGDPHFRAGVALLRMGLARQAADELRAVSTAGLAGGDPEPVALLADLLDRAGDHRSAHRLLRTAGRELLRRPPEGPTLRLWRVAYPDAYGTEIRRRAEEAGVPSHLLHALVREESALDPLAVSPAGAVGLTQLMPSTARAVARRLRMARPGRVDLRDASVNLRIGARYLSELLERYDGSAALALAAYNAGMGAVGRWLEEGRDRSLDEFVEEIPYDETRGYVKRVLRSYAAYHLLYGQPVEEALLLGPTRPGS
ncbi:MAG TPA: lytic transglycosylase domain-containing protein [Anaeromyxobacteraceae bacterium]|nr:lytic transglycosylase domain-containing protein [Anaeromyxobacteraceae bacterium]